MYTVKKFKLIATAFHVMFIEFIEAQYTEPLLTCTIILFWGNLECLVNICHTQILHYVAAWDLVKINIRAFSKFYHVSTQQIGLIVGVLPNQYNL